MNIGFYSRLRKRFAKGALLAFALPLMIPAIQAKEERDHKLAIQLFQLCSACHGPQGHGNRELMAPSIAGLPEWYVVNQLRKFRNGGRGAHPADLAGLRMRPMARTLDATLDKERNSREVDLHAVAHYVSELTPKQPKDELKGGDPARGKTIYLMCMACHGPNSEGNKDLKAPTQVYLEDWYMLEQLKKFKRGLRGLNPKDPEGLTMRPILIVALSKAKQDAEREGITVTDEQSMKDVIAYIRQTAREPTQEKPKPVVTPTNTPAKPE
jgi:cytochrome c553